MLEAAQRSTGLKPNEARSLLGRFLFSGEAAEKPLDGLSGGERRRLSLAILVHSGANVLVLDEPTNHLDLESREALEAALQSFQGSLLLISHDRALLDAVGTRTVAVEDGTLRSYVGGWPEYLRVREERAEAERTAKRAKPAKAPKPAPVPAEPQAVEEPGAPAKKIEAEIEAAEAALKTLEEELADPTAWNDPRTAPKSTKRHEQAKRALEDALRRVGGRRRLERQRPRGLPGRRRRSPGLHRRPRVVREQPVHAEREERAELRRSVHPRRQERRLRPERPRVHLQPGGVRVRQERRRLAQPPVLAPRDQLVLVRADRVRVARDLRHVRRGRPPSAARAGAPCAPAARAGSRPRRTG